MRYSHTRLPKVGGIHARSAVSGAPSRASTSHSWARPCYLGTFPQGRISDGTLDGCGRAVML